MTVKTVEGFAVVQNTVIDIKTVSPTRRAAIVNWIVTRKGAMIYQQTTDEEIEDLWERHRGDACVMQVDVCLSMPLF